METILKGTNPIIWHVFLWAVCILLDVHNLYRQMATRPLFLYSTLKNCTLLCLHMYRGTGSTGCLQQRPLTVQINFWQGEKTKQVFKNSQLLTAKKSKTELLYFFPLGETESLMLSMPEQWARNTTGHVAGANWGWWVQSFQAFKTLRTGSVSPEAFPRGQPPAQPLTPTLQQQNGAEEKCHKKLSPHRQCLPLDLGGLNSLRVSDLEQSQHEEKKDSEWTKQHKTQLFHPACCILW